ncbi:MAG: Clp protease N-terminal domain-containing protein [Anaerolineae bacterium]|nr:Clp protease N-terminal domain-containing protein [Anaerolineae bacterium]
MSAILLRDIQIYARQSAIQLRHYYVGVEHLFLALLQIQGGIAATTFEAQGIKTQQLVEAVRKRMGKPAAQRLWVGVPDTPRTEIVLDIARDVALDGDLKEVTERELLYAILTERDNLPARVMSKMGVDLDKLAQIVLNHETMNEALPPDIAIIQSAEFNSGQPLHREQQFMLRRMFPDHSAIRVERRLTGFSSALVLVVTPIRPEGGEDAPIVVKIDHTDSILDEYNRYQTYVKAALPLQTARLEDPPTTPDGTPLAGIKYTLVSQGVDGIPQDLRNRVSELGAAGLSRLIREQLYSEFNRTWWQQKRAFTFPVWKEYDWLLPPMLTLDYIPPDQPTPNVHLIRNPVNRAKLKLKLRELRPGDYVALENFVVQRVNMEADVVRLAAGTGSEAEKRAYKLDLRGVDHSGMNFSRGYAIERVIGQVVKTRDDLLTESLEQLEPDFSPRARWIPLDMLQIPNPLVHYGELLDRTVNGSFSRIHGDLHLGNIVIGPKEQPWLIDFSATRDGHTLFDWATLEVSLLGDVIMPQVGNTWQNARQVLVYLAAMTAQMPVTGMKTDVFIGMSAISSLREIVNECLTDPGDLMEYQIALGMCALRAITFPGMSLGGRRLMFLLSGLMLMELNQRASIQETLPADMTEVFQIPVSIPAEGAEAEPLPASPPPVDDGVIYLPPPRLPLSGDADSGTGEIPPGGR